MAYATYMTYVTYMASQSASRPASQPASQPAGRPAGQPAGQPASQPLSQPLSQQLSQPLSQPLPQGVYPTRRWFYLVNELVDTDLHAYIREHGRFENPQDPPSLQPISILRFWIPEGLTQA